MPSHWRAHELGFFGLAAVCFAIGHGSPEGPTPRFEPAERGEDCLRVVTWNVGGGGGHALRKRDEEHVVQCLTALDPQVCVLQELEDERQLRGLIERLGRRWVGALARHSNGRHVGALCREERLQTFDVATGDGTALGFQYSVSGERLAVIALHADAFSSRRRNAEIGAAADILLARSEPAKLLIGDFNLDLDLGKRHDLFSDDEYLDVETYNYVADRFVDAAIGLGSTAEPDRRLDYIFVAGDAFSIGDAGPWKGHRTGDMDHDPLVADLIFTP